MKLRYIKKGKLNYEGSQYRQGDILEVESLGQLPENWFEVIEADEVIEEVDEDKPAKKGKKKEEPKKETKEEVIDYGYKKSPNTDLGS